MFERMKGSGTALAAALVFAAAGCGGDGGGEAGGDGAGMEQQTMESPVDESTAGDVSGTVSFEGTPPEPQPIDMSSEPQCADQHDMQPVRETVVVGDEGGLGNVFVHVTGGLEDLEFPVPQEPVQLDQEGCVYQPHVLGLQVGQTLEILNSDGFLHNINAQPSTNRGFNISQPVDMTSTRTFGASEVMIPVRCDVHGWMTAYLGVKDHPYFAVTGTDGSFDLSTLPPGEYQVEAWHEQYGTATETVTVATGETAEIEFTFSESMAEGADVPLGDPVDLHDDDHHRVAAAEAGSR